MCDKQEQRCDVTYSVACTDKLQLQAEKFCVAHTEAEEHYINALFYNLLRKIRTQIQFSYLFSGPAGEKEERET